MRPPSTARRSPATTRLKVTEPEPGDLLHLVTGPEDVLADRAIDRIVRVVRTIAPDVAVIDIDADRYVAGDVLHHASPSLFGESTILIIHLGDQASDELLDETRKLIGQSAEGVVVVLHHRGGQRGKGLLDFSRRSGARIHACAKIGSDSEKAHFVVEEFRRMQRVITPDAASALVSALGRDMRELLSACSQLVADTTDTRGDDGAAGTGQVVIDEDTVYRYYGGRSDTTGFAVADAALAGRTNEALGLARRTLASGVDPVPLVAVLALGLRSLAKVSTVGSLRSADAGQQLAMASWQVDKARRQLRDWSPTGLAEAIQAVAAADLAVKGGLPNSGHRAGDPVYAVEKAILEIGKARRC